MDLRERAPRSSATPSRRRSCWRCSRSPTIASKRWAFEQYDSIVQSRTVRRPEAADAAVLQLAETGTRDRGLDRRQRPAGRLRSLRRGRSRRCSSAPQNLACVGAEPLGLTNCLNFGNPEKPTVAWQLDRSTQALADACEALGVPVVGGNVSLYNETERGPDLPDAGRRHGRRAALARGRCRGVALREGDAIALAGPFAPALAGSELAKLRGELGPGLAGFADRRRRGGDRRGPRGRPRRAAPRRPRRQRRRPRLRAGRVRDRRRRRRSRSTSAR